MAAYCVFEGAHCLNESSTGLALQIALPSKTVWIPKSVIGDDSEVKKEGQTGRLLVKYWFCSKEGLDDLADDEEGD